MRPGPQTDLPVVLCREPVDFRKGMASLAVLVEGALGRSPFSGQLFVFINRRRDAVKLLYWERNGFCLWHKRLEQARFPWPTHLVSAEGGGATMTVTRQQLQWLLDGLDVASLSPHKALTYETLL